MKNLQKVMIPKVTAELMVAKAAAAMKNTYPTPGKGYAVCVLTKAGTMYEGVSYNSDTQTLTMHSEATALAHAAIHGETDILAITGPNCHICKQLIWENALRSSIDIQVIIKEKDELIFVPISELMPYPWPDIDGNH